MYNAMQHHCAIRDTNHAATLLCAASAQMPPRWYVHTTNKQSATPAPPPPFKIESTF